MSEKESGTVKWFDEKKGYGFIARQAGGDVFVHYSDITGQGFRTLKEGDNVEFVVKQNQKGQAATDVIKV